jgi:hypothetical protein
LKNGLWPLEGGVSGNGNVILGHGAVDGDLLPGTPA